MNPTNWDKNSIGRAVGIFLLGMLTVFLVSNSTRASTCATQTIGPDACSTCASAGWCEAKPTREEPGQ